MKELSKPEKLRVLREAKKLIASGQERFMCIAVSRVLIGPILLSEREIRKLIPEFIRPKLAKPMWCSAWFDRNDPASRLRYLDELIEKIEND